MSSQLTDLDALTLIILLRQQRAISRDILVSAGMEAEAQENSGGMQAIDRIETKLEAGLTDGTFPADPVDQHDTRINLARETLRQLGEDHPKSLMRRRD